MHVLYSGGSMLCLTWVVHNRSNVVILRLIINCIGEGDCELYYTHGA